MNNMKSTVASVTRRVLVATLCLFAAVAEAQPLTNGTFEAFDLETTGLDEQGGRIVEIGAVKFRNGRVIGRRSWLVNPGMAMPASAQYVHGINDLMVEGCPAFRDVFPAFAKFTEDTVMIAHNAPFDTEFISAELARNGLSWQQPIILDTLPMFRLWFPDSPKHSLVALVEHLNIPHGRFHRALADSHYLARLFLAGLARLPREATLNDLIRTAGTRPESRSNRLPIFV